MTEFTFEQYVAQVNKRLVPEIRDGQRAFNVLYAMHPALAEKIRATQLDPFHVDERLPAFYEYVERHWEDA